MNLGCAAVVRWVDLVRTTIPEKTQSSGRKNLSSSSTQILQALFEPKAIGGGGKYNLVIIDDFSRKSWTIPLRLKSGTKMALKQWIAVRENEVGKRVKVMRSDNGGECGVFSAAYLYINNVLISSAKVAVIVRGSLTLLVFGLFFVFLVIHVYDLK